MLFRHIEGGVRSQGRVFLDEVVVVIPIVMILFFVGAMLVWFVCWSLFIVRSPTISLCVPASHVLRLGTLIRYVFIFEM